MIKRLNLRSEMDPVVRQLTRAVSFTKIRSCWNYFNDFSKSIFNEEQTNESRKSKKQTQIFQKHEF